MDSPSSTPPPASVSYTTTSRPNFNRRSARYLRDSFARSNSERCHTIQEGRDMSVDTEADSCDTPTKRLTHESSISLAMWPQSPATNKDICGPPICGQNQSFSLSTEPIPTPRQYFMAGMHARSLDHTGENTSIPSVPVVPANQKGTLLNYPVTSSSSTNKHRKASEGGSMNANWLGGGQRGTHQARSKNPKPTIVTATVTPAPVGFSTALGQRSNSMRRKTGSLVWQASGDSDRNPLMEVGGDIIRAGGMTCRSAMLRNSHATHRRVRRNRSKDKVSATWAKPIFATQNRVRIASETDPPTEHRNNSQKSRSDSNRRLSRRNKSEHELRQEMIQIRYRLCRRKLLFERRVSLSNYSLIVAMFGVLLAVVEGELSAPEQHMSDPMELLERKIQGIDSGADDWRVALTAGRIVRLSFEQLICLMCPIPHTRLVNWRIFISPTGLPNNTDIASNETSQERFVERFRNVEVPVDVLLTIPMFLRAYLIGRFMVLHSRLFQDAATRSIAALNHVTVDFSFVFKTLMMYEPLKVLITFTCIWWLVFSWMLTQCERYGYQYGTNDGHNMPVFLDQLWFTVITFMSIGYGDVVPRTYCGRTLGIATGIVGIGTASALIAVISRKLDLTRAEKHVNAFMADTKYLKKRKEVAALVIQHTWFIYKYRSDNPRKDDIRKHQRKFLSALNEFRQIKWMQRRLAEQTNQLIDVGKVESDVRDALLQMQSVQTDIVKTLVSLDSRIEDIYGFLMMNRPRIPSDNARYSPSGGRLSTCSFNVLLPEAALRYQRPNLVDMDMGHSSDQSGNLQPEETRSHNIMTYNLPEETRSHNVPPTYNLPAPPAFSISQTSLAEERV